MDDKNTPKRLLVTGVGIRRGIGHWFAGNSYVIGDKHADVTVTELPDEPTPGLPKGAVWSWERPTPGLVEAARALEAYDRRMTAHGKGTLGFKDLRAALEALPLAPAPDDWEEIPLDEPARKGEIHRTEYEQGDITAARLLRRWRKRPVTPPIPAEPAEYAVVIDKDGEAWQRREWIGNPGWSLADQRTQVHTWAEVNEHFGPLTVVYTPSAVES